MYKPVHITQGSLTFISGGKKHFLTLLFPVLLFSCKPEVNETVYDPYQIHSLIRNLDDSEENILIKYGYELFENTPDYLGPNSDNPYGGNNLSCSNCHLLAGTKPYSAPMIGVLDRYPQYRGREDKTGSIEDRIDGCMERSMNGKVFPHNSREMDAYKAYFKWLDRFSGADEKETGTGFVSIVLPERAVNLEQGKAIFMANCIICHGENGQGLRRPNTKGYLYPPLWGDDTYNNGAGMTRVITAAEFIKSNMPFGVTHDAPILTDEQCYDVAGYINSKIRPVKDSLEKDFPDLTKKPVSTPYPPFADNFSTEQHQFGPFQPIMEYYLKEYKIKKNK